MRVVVALAAIAVAASADVANAAAIERGQHVMLAPRRAQGTPAHGSPRVTPPRELRVALVVDFGVRSGVSPRVVTKCLVVPAGANGTDVLAEDAQAIDVADPTYSDSGLLCSIDGYPSQGCGTPSGTRYAYWSYWHGGSRWTYASVGPAEWTVTMGDVEGWRFENPGSGGPSDPPPSAPSTFARVCALATVRPVSSRSGAGRGAREPAVLLAIAALLVVGLATSSVRRWRRAGPA